MSPLNHKDTLYARGGLGTGARGVDDGWEVEFEGMVCSIRDDSASLARQ